MRYLVFFLIFPTMVWAQDPPVIPANQTRVVLSSAPIGGNVGDTLFATENPSGWTLNNEDNTAAPGVPVNDFFFTLDNSGQLKVLRSLEPLVSVNNTVAIDLTVEAFNVAGASGPESVSVIVILDAATTAGPVILAGQERSVVTNAAVGDPVGAPLFATLEPEAWAITFEDNNGIFPADERYFEVASDGQLTVLRPLQPFFPGRLQTDITLTMQAFNANGSSIEEDVIVHIIEGDHPTIYPAQVRSILSTHAIGAPIGQPLQASGDPTYWNILGGNSSGIFTLDNEGQLSIAANFDPDSFTTNPELFTLEVEAGNEDGPSLGEDVVISVGIGDCGHIPATQTRFVSSIALPDDQIGFPVDTHNLDSVWIEEAWVDAGQVVPGATPEDVTTAFSIDAEGSTLGQLNVLRPLSEIFDTELITKINIRVKGHAIPAGCPGFAEELVVLYVLPSDAGSGTGGGTGGTGGGTVDPETDFSTFILDDNLRACIRSSFGLAASEPLTADLVLGTTHLDCLCRSNSAVTDLSGIHLFIGLEFLSLANNLITDIEQLSGLTELKDLRLSNNLITDVTTGNPLASMVNLERLDLSNNQIEDANAFSTLANINFLSIANNQICDIASLAALANLPGESGIKIGDTIHLDNNHLTSTQALSDIGIIQSTGAFVTTDGQTACTTFSVITLDTWPINTVADFAELLNGRAIPPCNP